MPSNAERRAREAANQAVFRDVNERIHDAYGALGPDGPATFVCECGDGTCLAMIPVPVPSYCEVRVNPLRFIVAPGHEAPEAERVVERHDRWVVAETILDAAEVARART